MFYLDTVVLSAKAGLHESHIYERFRFLFLISFEKKEKYIFLKLGINLK